MSADTAGGFRSVLAPGVPVAMDVVRRLQSLLDDAERRNRLAAIVRDPRLPEATWQVVFAREIAHTLGWAVERLLGRTRATGGIWAGRGAVAAVLPRHGLAVHVLRRALPFAACGFRTTVTGHPDQADDIRAVVVALADALGVPAMTVGSTAVAAVTGADAADLVVLTGSAESERAVRRSCHAQVVAATGGCAILVGDDPEVLREAESSLRAHDQPGSCTRWGGTWLGKPELDQWQGPDGSAQPVSTILAAARPSVVYQAVTELEGSSVARKVCGYSLISCDAAGVTATLIGFGRDPVSGWPGDFLV